MRGLVINRFALTGIDVGRDTLEPPIAGVRIAGNFLGTDPTGTAARSNNRGVTVYKGGRTTIGGIDRADRNLISGNAEQGVMVNYSVAAGNVVQGNLIGTQRDGRSPRGNGLAGVLVMDAANVVVGGNAAGAANTIAYTRSGPGVAVIGGQNRIGNQILRNAVFANADLGIDLIGEGGTDPNDPADADTGANGLQNTPVLGKATTTTAGTRVGGRSESRPDRTFLLQFFANPAGEDEGRLYVGERTVTTDGNGAARFAITLQPAIPAGRTITATATGADGTSEFSASVVVEAG